MSHFVENPEDRLCRVDALIVLLFYVLLSVCLCLSSNVSSSRCHICGYVICNSRIPCKYSLVLADTYMEHYLSKQPFT